MTGDSLAKPVVAKIGLATAVAIVVANMVGTGVFGSLGYQVADIPTGFPIVLLWTLGGVVSFCGAVCYAEMASIFPRSGGEYHMLSKTFHPAVGFLTGWLSVAVGFAAPIATNALLLGMYLGEVFGVAPEVFSLSAVVLVSLVHLGRMSSIGLFQSGFTYAKIALILVLGVLAFTMGDWQGVSFLPQEGDGKLITSNAFVTSFVFVLYAYTGWNAATYMMDEVKNAERVVPRALLIGTVVVTLLYVFVNVAFLYATPVEDMAGKGEVGLIAATAILGAKGGTVMGILISFGLISTISSMTWAGSRVAAAIGRDYRAFAVFTKRNRNGVPWVAILFQTILVMVLVLQAGFVELINYIQALLTLSSLLVVVGVVYLRIRRPDLARPYRAWGYPVTPLVFAVISAYVLRVQILEKTTEFFYALGTLAVGLVLYGIFARQRVDGTQDS